MSRSNFSVLSCDSMPHLKNNAQFGVLHCLELISNFIYDIEENMVNEKDCMHLLNVVDVYSLVIPMEICKNLKEFISNELLKAVCFDWYDGIPDDQLEMKDGEYLVPITDYAEMIFRKNIAHNIDVIKEQFTDFIDKKIRPVM